MFARLLASFLFSILVMTAANAAPGQFRLEIHNPDSFLDGGGEPFKTLHPSVSQESWNAKLYKYAILQALAKLGPAVSPEQVWEERCRLRFEHARGSLSEAFKRAYNQIAPKEVARLSLSRLVVMDLTLELIPDSGFFMLWIDHQLFEGVRENPYSGIVYQQLLQSVVVAEIKAQAQALRRSGGLQPPFCK